MFVNFILEIVHCFKVSGIVFRDFNKEIVFSTAKQSEMSKSMIIFFLLLQQHIKLNE